MYWLVRAVFCIIVSNHSVSVAWKPWCIPNRGRMATLQHRNIATLIHMHLLTYAHFPFCAVTSWWEDLGQLEPPVAGIPQSLHAALHAAFHAAKSGTEPCAADPCRAAASGQCRSGRLVFLSPSSQCGWWVKVDFFRRLLPMWESKLPNQMLETNITKKKEILYAYKKHSFTKIDTKS